MHFQAHRFLTLSCLVIAAAVMLPVSIKAQRQSLHLPAREVVLQKLFREITKQTGLAVFYSDALIDDREIRRFLTPTLTLSAVLDSIVAGRPLKYEIKPDCILFSADPKKTIPRGETSPGQLGPAAVQHAVNGRIVDEQNIGLAGVTISIKGGKPVAISGGDGGFFIPSVMDADRLIFSAVTIDSFETAVAGKTSMLLIAKTRVSQLQEVIVLNKGYYTERQKLSVGNTVKVTKEQMSTQSVTNPLSQLQGRVAGLMITSNSGSAGTGFDVMIRGRNSIQNGTDPLYIIDGVPYIAQLDLFRNTAVATIDGNTSLPSPLYFLNPNDIISIDVQKDADACSIYGARGANGVILISTRKASTGKFHLNAQLSGGFGKVAHFTKRLNSEEYIAYRREALDNDRKAVGPLDFDLNGDWGDNVSPRNWDKLLRGNTAWMHNASIDVSGGSDIFKYLCSGGYSNEGSITPGNFNNFKKFFHSSIEIASANKKFSLVYSADLITTDSRVPQYITDKSRYYPISPPLYDAGGELNWQGNTFYNPYASLEPHFRISARNILNSITTQYVLSKELTIKILTGLNNIKLDDVDAMPTTSYLPAQNVVYGSSSFGFNTFFSSNIEPQLLYAQNFRKIKLAATVGYSYQRSVFDGYTQNGTGYLRNDLLETIAAATNISNGHSSHIDYKYNAVFARGNVNWQDRFIINLTARRDGSSRFGNQNSFANFWSAAGGWIFVSGKDRSVVPGLTYGKIRVSVGLTGNDQVGDYRYQSVYNYLNYQVPYQGTQGLYPAALVNKDLSWEKTFKSEIGLELSFMGERLTFAASYFSNRSGSQLVLTPLPSITGFWWHDSQY
jgi:TonB-linked SusC/RagA family outer membrane protein